MAEAAIAEIGDKLVGLTLKEAVDLADYLKETYNIEPAAGGAVVMAGGGGGRAVCVVACSNVAPVTLCRSAPRYGFRKVSRSTATCTTCTGAPPSLAACTPPGCLALSYDDACMRRNRTL